jgi:serine phosphatase RsbU (regulator of sigma subunit)/anti-sigma regulatory factor (Ser/Thr protein kinase)
MAEAEHRVRRAFRLGRARQRTRPIDSKLIVGRSEVPPGRADNWQSPAKVRKRRVRTQMVALGLVGVLLNLLIVRTAQTNLHRVDVAYQTVAEIDAAQRWFQDADMMHDTLHSDVLQSIVGPEPTPPFGGLREQVAAHSARFRSDMERVDRGGIGGELLAAVEAVEPLQDQYLDESMRIVTIAASSPSAGRAALPHFSGLFSALEVQQGRVTVLMARDSTATQAHADHDEGVARREIIAASLAALVGLIFLTFLLARLGGRLAVLAARERGTAETLQHSLLPDQLPDLPGVRMAARYVPGGVGVDVGGDWYDVIVLPAGEVGLVMGDVAGHDLRAAAVMGQLRNALRAYAGEGLAPHKALERLNRLCNQHDVNEMATCVFAVLDPVSSTLRISNAGHYPLLLRQPDGAVRLLELPAGPPVGAVRQVRYDERLVQLEPGTMIVMYTDGLVERRGVGVEEGLARLQRAVADGPADVSQLADHILQALLERRRPPDDVALMVVEPAADLGRRLTLRFPADSIQLVTLRRTLQRWLTESGASAEEAYEVIVAASEAATNAIEHAYGPGPAFFEVRCEARDGLVEISVQDKGRWRSSRGTGRGRGLHIIEGLMDEVDIVRNDTGSKITFTRMLARPPSAAPLAARELIR